MDSKRSKDIGKIVKYVVDKHDGQFRKEPRDAPLPYIVHPMDVLRQVAQWGVTDLVIWKAALGHDVREDCGVTIDEAQKVFGVKSADIIEELTFIPNGAAGYTVPQQKQEYMRSFFTKSVPALTIKIADRCCNTLDWMDTDPDYAPKYWNKADDLFSAMVTRKEDIVKFYGGPDPKVLKTKDRDKRKEAERKRELGEAIYTRMFYTRTQIARMLV